MRLTSDEAAFAAWHWSIGISQRRIGQWFGLGTSGVCLAISGFIKGHSDARTDHWGCLLDNEMPRQKMAGIVSENYCKYRGGKLRIRVKVQYGAQV